ncbi:uncharacterized protein DUF664 [Tamaricihabitans halophyticus]|uniref:Uncharacterized protein DUF664 n=1 Tax=Tamaricihabitans halophyticus TaxID=1262583 RepID=A0A4R2R6G2_9PSEU|nr:DinB family protein [Tamaricihabitans halophyticus]TCP57459.1 uncharacterized protein DUF664 [Tamaricihabitans halophyticus]
MSDATTTPSSGERADLLASLAHARQFLRFTARDLTTEQSGERTTISALTIGGLIKHVTDVERGWADFIVSGAPAMGKEFADWTEEDFAEREKEFQMQPGDTLPGVLASYAEVAARTDELVRTLPSLEVSHELPKAPWNTDVAWSARRVVLHIIAETTQHAGHADIIRESLDGAKSMG